MSIETPAWRSRFRLAAGLLLHPPRDSDGHYAERPGELLADIAEWYAADEADSPGAAFADARIRLPEDLYTALMQDALAQWRDEHDLRPGAAEPDAEMILARHLDALIPQLLTQYAAQRYLLPQ